MRKPGLHLSNVLLFSLIFCMSCTGRSCTDRTIPTSVGFGRIKSEGELAQRISRNFDRMETELYQPAKVYWSEKESNGWPGDKEGRTILALTLDARAAERTPVYLAELVNLLPEKLNKQGYMGSIYEDHYDEQQVSGHGWLLRGLCEYYAWKNDPKTLEIIGTIVDSLFLPMVSYVDRYPISSAERKIGTGDMSGTIQNLINGWAVSSDVGCIFIGMEGLIHSYEYRPSEESRRLITKLIDLFLRMDLIETKAQTHASLTAMRGLLRFSQLGGDSSLIAEVEKRWELYKEYGMTENYANYNWFKRYDTWTEPCAIIDSYMLATQLWTLTTKEQYLEDAELIYYNAISVAQRANGGFGCDIAVGQESSMVGIHCNEAHWCCTMRGGEGLPRVAESSYYTDGKRIIIPFFRENTLEIPEQGVTIKQRTDYPFANSVQIAVENAPKQGVELSLFIPSYISNTTLYVDGNKVDAKIENSFINLNARSGSVVNLCFEQIARVCKPANADLKGSALRKVLVGPLLMAYDAEEVLSIEANAKISKASDGGYHISGIDKTFTPLYHLLDPAVSSEHNYHRGVLVTSNPR